MKHNLTFKHELQVFSRDVAEYQKHAKDKVQESLGPLPESPTTPTVEPKEEKETIAKGKIRNNNTSVKFLFLNPVYAIL